LTDAVLSAADTGRRAGSTWSRPRPCPAQVDWPRPAVAAASTAARPWRADPRPVGGVSRPGSLPDAGRLCCSTTVAADAGCRAEPDGRPRCGGPTTGEAPEPSRSRSSRRRWPWRWSKPQARWRSCSRRNSSAAGE